MAIVFPASPSVNDTFTTGSITYKWDGDKWIGLGVTPADRLVEGSNSLEIDANNNLVWTGSDVGLGTASPTQKFDVRGSIYVGDNIGINDTSPDNKLHITTTSSSAYSTNTTNTSNLTNALLKLQNLDGSDGTGANNYVGIQFSVANGATSTAQMQYVRTGDNAGKFEFKARNGSTNYPNLLTLKSNNDIGINKPNPEAWGGGVPTIEIKGTAATGGNSTRSGAIAFESGSGNNGYAALWGQEGGIHIYTSATDRASVAYSSKFHSDGNLHFASGKGIDFSASGIEASGTITSTNQLFDDYEEGLWSPRLIGSTSGEASGYNHRKAGYVKIGNLVHVYGYLALSNVGTITGNVRITDFPFVTKNDTAYYHAPAFGWYTGMGGTTAYGLGLDMAAGNTTHTIVRGNGTGVSSLTVGEINNNFAVEWAFTYRTS